MASITVRVSDELNERLKERVVKNATTASAFVIAALQASLDGEDDHDKTDWTKLGYPAIAGEVTTRFKRSAEKKAPKH